MVRGKLLDTLEAKVQFSSFFYSLHVRWQRPLWCGGKTGGAAELGLGALSTSVRSWESMGGHGLGKAGGPLWLGNLDIFGSGESGKMSVWSQQSDPIFYFVA